MAGNNKSAQPSAAVRIRRSLRFVRTRLRELRMIGKALTSTKHPILVHIIPNRRCNLACTYCNEFDDFSKPVPLDEMKNRLDILAGMGHLQISIDNAVPDEVSLKSLKTLDTRLEWLAEYAVFQVNINSVLGSGVKNP